MLEWIYRENDARGHDWLGAFPVTIYHTHAWQIYVSVHKNKQTTPHINLVSDERAESLIGKETSFPFNILLSFINTVYLIISFHTVSFTGITSSIDKKKKKKPKLFSPCKWVSKPSSVWVPW